MQRVNDNLITAHAWQLVSMTGLGRARFVNNDFNIEVIIRSVNQRGLEIKYRLPDRLNGLDAHLSPIISEFIHRGRLDVQINCDLHRSDASGLVIDHAKAASLILAAANLSDKFPEVLPISMGDILAVPHILQDQESELNEEEIKPLIIATLKEALQDLLKSRGREGEALGNVLKQIFGHCVSVIEAIDQSQQRDVEKRFSRFKNRMDELFKAYDISQDRLYQEFALLAERSDFKEEIDRLRAHVEHFETLCQLRETKGRKLDFLCQEMLRESNTLMSKACDSAVTILAIDLKAEIERIREQVQNIE